METENALTGLEQRWPGRESLVSSLYASWSAYPPPFMHISDPTTANATEQLLSSLLQVVRQNSGLFSVQLDATECITSKLLFDRILNGLADWTPSWEDGALNWVSTLDERYTENLDGFIHALQALHRIRAKPEAQGGPNMVIIISKAERLKELLPNIVTPLARLADLTNLPISTVFLSHLPWDEVRPAIGSSTVPYIIDLTPLTPLETTTMLKNQFAALADETSINPFHPILASLFSSYAELVHGICQPYTSDALDISYILATHWPLYISPLLNDWTDHNEKGEEYEMPATAQTRLNALFRQTIGASVQPLHLRLISATDYISQTSPDDFSLRISQIGHIPVALKGRKEPESSTGKDESSNVISLPLMARYILVASYLASFNPTTMDIRILGQIRDPTKKYKKGGARKQRTGVALKIGHLLSGPATFASDRLWAISGALLEVFGNNEKPPWANPYAPSGTFSEAEVSRAHFIGQIENLVSRRLLVRTTPQEKIEGQASFRCVISMEQASSISDSLGFRLGPLLYEEVH